MKNTEIEAMRRELQSRNMELHNRDAILSQAASETMEARAKLVTREARFNHEVLVLKQNVRQGENDMKEEMRILEDHVAREREETSVYEQLIARVSHEKKDMHNVEISVARERDSLIATQALSLATPVSPSSAANQQVQSCKDQVVLKDTMLHELQESLQDVTGRHLETCRLLDREREKYEIAIRSTVGDEVSPKSRPRRRDTRASLVEIATDMREQMEVAQREARNARDSQAAIAVKTEGVLQDRIADQFHDDIKELRDELRERDAKISNEEMRSEQKEKQIQKLND
eukprot:s503_g9.t1